MDGKEICITANQFYLIFKYSTNPNHSIIYRFTFISLKTCSALLVMCVGENNK